MTSLCSLFSYALVSVKSGRHWWYVKSGTHSKFGLCRKCVFMAKIISDI